MALGEQKWNVALGQGKAQIGLLDDLRSRDTLLAKRQNISNYMYSVTSLRQ